MPRVLSHAFCCCPPDGLVRLRHRASPMASSVNSVVSALPRACPIGSTRSSDTRLLTWWACCRTPPLTTRSSASTAVRLARDSLPKQLSYQLVRRRDDPGGTRRVEYSQRRGVDLPVSQFTASVEDLMGVVVD